ncbi:MAG TPA: crosslink repair DNA glycosylase YcaQ family protein, partial [Pyrinomonadaceae bacterium]
MSRSEIVYQRLNNQRLSFSEFRRPVDVVHWLGAVQAQDFSGAKWALAQRMRDTTDADIEQAYNEGQILRTHLMRPTWHFVAPDDIRWLLRLTAPRVNIACGTNYRKFELDDGTFKRCNKILTSALKGGRYLTRASPKDLERFRNCCARFSAFSTYS